MHNVEIDNTSILVMVVMFVPLWIIPVVMGIRACKRKNISAHWMWLGAHPFFAWIAYFVIRFSVDPRKKCPQCKESIKRDALICRYCKLKFDLEQNERDA